MKRTYYYTKYPWSPKATGRSQSLGMLKSFPLLFPALICAGIAYLTDDYCFAHPVILILVFAVLLFLEILYFKHEGKRIEEIAERDLIENSLKEPIPMQPLTAVERIMLNNGIPISPKPIKRLFCEKCGKELREDALYCPKCGKKTKYP